MGCNDQYNNFPANQQFARKGCCNSNTTLRCDERLV